MKRRETYNTKQREAILTYIKSLEGAHVTAAQIAEHFEKESISVGRVTIYRHLEKLMVRGKLRRYTTDGTSGFCYQYIDDRVDCLNHMHLKCEGCGELLHMECDKLDEINNHVLYEHAFRIDTLKTVLYGKCKGCLQSEGYL